MITTAVQDFNLLSVIATAIARTEHAGEIASEMVVQAQVAVHEHRHDDAHAITDAVKEILRAADEHHRRKQFAAGQMHFELAACSTNHPTV